jgi:PKHD-type hydroxylase
MKNRDSKVGFFFPNDVTQWVFQKCTELVLQMNARFFWFDLYALEQGLQFTSYTAPGQHYDWHIDHGKAHGNRKLSFTVQLSDPSDYEGGELQLKFGREPITVKRQLGGVTVFPSYALHRVKPVTKGTRETLVGWVSGPPFK